MNDARYWATIFIDGEELYQAYLTKSEINPGQIIDTREWDEPGEYALQVIKHDEHSAGFDVHCVIGQI